MDGGLQHCTEGGNQNHLKKKKCKKAKWLSEETLQIAEDKNNNNNNMSETKEKKKYIHI